MNEYLELLKSLIRCKAVTADVPAVNRAESVMQQFLAGHGLACKVETDAEGRNILYASPKGLAKPDYILNAHLDVVPAPDEMFVPEVNGNEIIGRGTSDCQGCAVAIARALVLAGAKGKAGAFFSMDEETGGTTTAEMVKRGYTAKKMAIIIDAGPWAIYYSQKGIINARLIAHGKAGHSSEPWAFDNAMDRLITGYVKIREAWPKMAPEIWGDTMAATVIRSGDADNRIPDYAEMNLNIRYVNPGDDEKIIRRMKELSGLEIVTGHACPPVTCDPEHPEIVKLRKFMQQHFSREIGLGRMCGATDARHFPAETPVAILGIEGSGCHSTYEKANIDCIRLYSEMLAEFIA